MSKKVLKCKIWYENIKDTDPDEYRGNINDSNNILIDQHSKSEIHAMNMIQETIKVLQEEYNKIKNGVW